MKNLLLAILMSMPLLGITQDTYRTFPSGGENLLIKVDRDKYHVFVQMIATESNNKDLYLFLSKRKLISFQKAMSRARSEFQKLSFNSNSFSQVLNITFIGYSAFRTYRWNYDYSVKVKFEFVKSEGQSDPELVLSVGYMYNSLHYSEKINGGSISLRGLTQIDEFMKALDVENIETFIAKQ